MYAGAGYSDWEIGDIDVFVHEGEYHLFHLIIPNHDYIAHAVSRDGMSWRRVKNALFVGDPGSWDDDMLWTMHVSRGEDRFLMYYTGLRRSDRGTSQSIGLATSSDLGAWEKSEGPGWPLESAGPYYESRSQNDRGWISFRDPFRFRHGGDDYLLVCARSSEGPISRRGCVGLARWDGEQYRMGPPLLYPRMYDDIECPSVVELGGRFYLVGSIREDIKVRYWAADSFRGNYRSFHSDILLPRGNYAARVVKDGPHQLIYNFYFTDRQVNSLRVLPPPKQLDVDEKGRLLLRSFHRWEEKVTDVVKQEGLEQPVPLLRNPTSAQELDGRTWRFSSESGYEIFSLPKPASSLIWEGTLTLEGLGKCGLHIDSDSQGNGFFFPFDFVGQYVTARTWGFNEADSRNNFVFKNLQSNLFKSARKNSVYFRLIRYGNYYELSIDGIVVLTLMDYSMSGDRMGIYAASSVVSLRDSVVKLLPTPVDEYASQEATLNVEAPG